MNVGDKYTDKRGSTAAESSAFVFGGAGVEIPLSRYVALFGTANALFTTEKGVNEEDIQNTSHINTSVMYNAGLRLNLGMAANGEKKYKRYLNRRLDAQREALNEKINELRANYDEQIDNYDKKISDYDTKIAEYDQQIARYEERVNALKADYEKRIGKLDRDLDQALKANDTIRVAELARLRDRDKQELEGIENDELAMKRKMICELGQNHGNSMKMTRGELNELVGRIIREARECARCGDYGYSYEQPQPPCRSVAPSQVLEPVQNNETELLRRELRVVNEKLDKVISQGNNGKTTVIYGDNATPRTELAPATVYNEGAYHPATGNHFKLNRVSVFTGLGFGDLTAWNVGVRGYMQVASTNLDFVPELYASMADKSGMGVSANIIYNFKINSLGKFTPYAGFGLGIFHGKDTHFGSNIIVGVSTDMLGGKVFADYSARSLTKQNQVAIGYSFIF